MRLSNFSNTKTLVMGALLIFWGLTSFCLGIPSATPANMSYPFGHLGYGIWCGIFFVLVGVFDIILGCRTTPTLVIWGAVLNISACILGVLQMALGITAANQDFNVMRVRDALSNLGTTDPEYRKNQELLSFYQQFFPMTYKIANSPNLVPYVHNGTVAVDSLLAICGIFAAIFAAIAACSACKVICCPNIKTDLDTVTVVSATHHEARQKPTNQMMHENLGFQGATTQQVQA